MYAKYGELYIYRKAPSLVLKKLIKDNQPVPGPF